jgi:hypothetical protein
MPSDQRVTCGVHAGKQRVAADLWHLARIEHRAQCRHLVVTMIGVPAAADIASLLRLLADLGDRRMIGDMREEAVDVDRAKALGNRDVLLRRELLIAKEHDAVFAERAADLAERLVAHGPRQIDTADLRAHISRRRHDPDVLIVHAILPAASAVAV